MLWVDGLFLAEHHLLRPAQVEVRGSVAGGGLELAARLGRLDISAGPHLLHTARQSAAVWRQVVKLLLIGHLETGHLQLDLTVQVLDRLGGQTGPAPLVSLAHTLVCNETGCEVGLGQAGTEELLVLQPGQALQYTWRSHKATQRLRVQIAGQWSEPFRSGL